jgi:signal transduction histidine kinase
MLPGGGKTRYREIHQKYAAQGIASLINKISAAESWLVILIAILVLAGWQFNVEILKRAWPSFFPMNPLTAVCFIASGVALLLVRNYQAARLRRWEKLLLGLAVAVTGALILTRYVFHISFMPDRALFTSKLGIIGSGIQKPNAMAPNTALDFVLIGISLMLFDARAKIVRNLSQFLATIVTFLSLVAILGYTYDSKALLQFRAFIPIAVHSAVCFLLLGTAILCARPQQGFIRLFSSEGGAGYIMRRLLIPAVLLPTILGWLRIQGQRANLYNTEIGVALTVAANIVLGCILVWITGYVLNKKEHEIDQAKDEFLSLVAHQLRTPATSAKLGLAMLSDRTEGPLNDEQAKLVAVALESCNLETQLINNLLNVARMDAGRVTLKKVPADLGEIARETVREQKPVIDLRRQRVDLADPPLPIVADADRLKMAIDNLVSNASKYTPEGGELSVTVKKLGNKAVVEVADKGVGMAQDDIPKIFTKFTRLDNPLSKERGGTGLGVYLAKKIVELHKGKLTVNSELGKGSQFTIELPLH